jgi:NDP-sugar pyrophosphorylase family protein
MTLSPVCILAGGMATRLGDVAKTLPKALMPVAGEPFLFHQLRLLRSHGARRVVLCVAHLGDQIAAAVGDGSALGLEVAVVHDGPEPIGTAGAVRKALPELGDEFLLLYGDTYLRIDYADVQRAFRASGAPALMTVLRNEGRWDTSNAVFEDGWVTRHDKRNPTPDMAWIDYGLSVLTPRALDAAPGAPDLAEVFAALADRGELAGYEATNRFYEIGTPDALAETEEWLRSTGAGGEKPRYPAAGS